MSKENKQQTLVKKILAHEMEELRFGYVREDWFGGLLSAGKLTGTAAEGAKAVYQHSTRQNLKQLVRDLEQSNEMVDGFYCADDILQNASVDDIFRFCEGVSTQIDAKWVTLSNDLDDWTQKVTEADNLQHIYMFAYVYVVGPSVASERFLFKNVHDLLIEHLSGK